MPIEDRDLGRMAEAQKIVGRPVTSADVAAHLAAPTLPKVQLAAPEVELPEAPAVEDETTLPPPRRRGRPPKVVAPS